MIDIEKIKHLALDGDMYAVQELITRLEAAEKQVSSLTEELNERCADQCRLQTKCDAAESNLNTCNIEYGDVRDSYIYYKAKYEAAEKDAARFRWLAGTTSGNEAYNETHANWPSGKLADCVDEAMKGSA